MDFVSNLSGKTLLIHLQNTGRLSRHHGETSKRLAEDKYAKLKYDLTEEQDKIIIDRVAELANKKNISMTEVSLAWLIKKGAIPVAGATKISQIDGMVKSVDAELTEEEIKYLEEPYVPHKLVGVMAENLKWLLIEERSFSPLFIVTNY